MDPWYAVTLIGSPELWAGVALVLALFYGWWHQRMPRQQLKKVERFVLVLCLGVALTFLTVALLKAGLQVPRPCAPCTELPAAVGSCNPYCPADDPHGFPSGHAATIFAVFAAGWFGLGGRGELRRPRWYPVAVVVPLLVAASRVALGVHSVWDAVGGTVLGILVVYIVSLFVQKYITV